MKTTTEILKEIEAIDKQTSELAMKRRELTEDIIKSAEKEFEERAGVKRGDMITTKQGFTYFYDGFNKMRYGTFIYILCHPPKKDGTPSLINEYLTPEDFGISMNINSIFY